MSALPKRYFTPEEYLELECKAEYKSQYVAGEIYVMAGAEPEHGEIITNLVLALGNRLLDRPCKVYSNEVRVRVKAGELFTYPDVAVVCGERKHDTAKPRSLLNPQVVFEVLSPSTEGFDRGDKFARYQRLDSLTDYVLVAVDRMRVEHFARQSDGSWRLVIHSQPEHRLALAGLNCDAPLAEIYRRVEFADPAE